MKNIERLFKDDRPVPGMRPTGRIPSGAHVEDLEASLAEVEAPAPQSSAGSGAQAAVHAPEHEDEPAGGAAAPEQRGPTRGFPLTVVEPTRVVPGPQLLSAHDATHPHSEKIRLLRTEILLRHTARDEGMGVAVLSAGRGEGRSQVAAELALAFAQLGRSTLLLDADLRHPQLHKLFGTPQHNGLAQAITGDPAAEMLGVEGYPTLSLMTAGAAPENPLELLSDGRFESLMSELRERFDFIVVDTPQCADYADALVVATVVGHVLTVHRARRTRQKAARAMMRQLSSARADVLGAVLNHF
jgi:receptor protein-tyrosine kinase